jgi:hypothetical protein
MVRLVEPMPSSHPGLNSELLAVLRQQVAVAWTAMQRAGSGADGTTDRAQLAFARRTFEAAMSLRQRLELPSDMQDEIGERLAQVGLALDQQSDLPSAADVPRPPATPVAN